MEEKGFERYKATGHHETLHKRIAPLLAHTGTHAYFRYLFSFTYVPFKVGVWTPPDTLSSIFCHMYPLISQAPEALDLVLLFRQLLFSPRGAFSFVSKAQCVPFLLT